MDPFSIAALVAMVAGAGMQYKASTDATERQQREIQASLMRQKEFQKQAEKKALDTAATFETQKRAQQQEELATQIERSLIQPVAESQALRNDQATTQGDVSKDYVTAKAKSELETMKQAEGLARLLGKTTSAGRLRLNEGIRMMDAGMDVDRLGNFSRNQQAADQIAIQNAGVPDAGLSFAGSVLSALGSAGMVLGGTAATGATNAANTGSSVGLKAGATGVGLNPAASGAGLKVPGGMWVLR